MGEEDKDAQSKIWDNAIVQKIILIAFILIAFGLLVYALTSALK